MKRFSPPAELRPVHQRCFEFVERSRRRERLVQADHPRRDRFGNRFTLGFAPEGVMSRPRFPRRRTKLCGTCMAFPLREERSTKDGGDSGSRESLTRDELCPKSTKRHSRCSAVNALCRARSRARSALLGELRPHHAAPLDRCSRLMTRAVPIVCARASTRSG